MQVGVRRVVVRTLAAALSLPVVVLGLAAADPASAGTTVPAAAAVATSVRLTVEPGTTLEPSTPATFRATVTPSTATGTVTFREDGQVVAIAGLVGGQAVLERNRNPVGAVRLVGEYVPAAGSDHLPSASAPLDVVVADLPSVSVARADGTSVAYGGDVASGSALRFAVSGFPAGVQVEFLVGSTTLPESVTTDSNGIGSAAISLPGSLPARAYLVVAAGGQRSAVHKLTVRAAPSPSPSTTSASSVSVTIPAPGSAPSPTPTPSPSSTAEDDGDGPIPSTGGELPRTGGDPLAFMLVAGLLLVAGFGMTNLARPVAASGT